MSTPDFTPGLIRVSPNASTATKFAAMQSNFLLGIDRPLSDTEIHFMGDLGRCVLGSTPTPDSETDGVPIAFNASALFDGLTKELEAVRKMQTTAEGIIQEIH